MRRCSGTEVRLRTVFFFPSIVNPPFVKINVGLLANYGGKTATHTLDGGQGEDDLLLAINVGVEHA